MHKHLSAHEQKIIADITFFQAEIKSAKNKNEIETISKQIDDLYDYHQSVVHDLQHERLIHLIVTLFFGLLLILSAAAVFLMGQSQSVYNNIFVTYPIMAICMMLFVVEIFYIFYYYKLENGCQRLYVLSKKLYAITHEH